MEGFYVDVLLAVAKAFEAASHHVAARPAGEVHLVVFEPDRLRGHDLIGRLELEHAVLVDPR